VHHFEIAVDAPDSQTAIWNCIDYYPFCHLQRISSKISPWVVAPGRRCGNGRLLYLYVLSNGREHPLSNGFVV
jgi:hypothetical protein